MTSKKTVYFSFFNILCLLIFSDVGNSELLASKCDNTTVYNVTSPNGSLYLRNMVSLFSVLTSNASQPSGFYNYTAGGGILGPAVYGLFLCRGDATATVCRTCLNSAVADILLSCSNATRAITWFDDCMLRYSDQPIAAKLQTEGGIRIRKLANVTDAALLNRTLSEVFTKITNEAAYGDLVPGKKYAVAEANFTYFEKIFAMGQCTPDIGNLDCEFCLRDALLEFPSCCSDKVGGYVLHPSCSVRYSIWPFFHAVIPPPPPPTPVLPPPAPQPAAALLPPSPPSLQHAPPLALPGGGGTSATTIAAVVSPMATAFVAFVVAFFINC